MKIWEVPWLQWFASGLDELAYREAKKHPYFLPWFRSVVDQACERVEIRIAAENAAKPPPFPLEPRSEPNMQDYTAPPHPFMTTTGVNIFAGMSVADQADAIRKADLSLHPFINFGLSLMPPAIRPTAMATDAWLYNLIQTPGVLEQILEIFPAAKPTAPPSA